MTGAIAGTAVLDVPKESEQETKQKNSEVESNNINSE